MKTLVVTIPIFCVAAFLGCSGSKEAGSGSAAQHEEQKAVSGPAHEMAKQHMINGSLFEMKGEHAQAVLEFQDALRYERSSGAYFALAKNYAALNKQTLAIDAARDAVRLQPDNLEYRRMLAGSYVQIFELDSALHQYEQIVKLDSNSIDSWFGLARLYQARKPEKALQTYDEIINRFGPQWEVLLQIVEMHNSTGNFLKAAEAMKRMTEIDPSNLDLQQSLGRAYMRANQTDEALKVYRDLIERDPDNLEFRTEFGGVYLTRKEYANANEQFDRVLTNDTLDVEAKLRVGELYFGQLEKDSTIAPVALKVFDTISRRHPKEWRAYWFIGAIGAITKNDSLSLVNFRRVTELASWNADGWVYLSSVFLDRNDFQSVVTVLESALKTLPDDVRVNSILGIAYSRLGRTEDAIRVLERARTIDPKDLNTITQLALIYDGLKRYDESDSLYEAALRIDPNNHLTLNNYSYSMSERGIQLQRALEMAKKAIEQQPENQSYLDTIGWIYFKLGIYSEAEKYVKKAIEKGNANAVLYEHMGDIYARMNDTERALEQWNIALKLDANNTALREKIQRSTTR
ncbi:MAG: tetratricopeptide repeat protein [Ignavibacteriae bacterium]|nr:tetratricopeptide repeat protein [Ignavibacteriota bacterium]